MAQHPPQPGHAGPHVPAGQASHAGDVVRRLLHVASALRHYLELDLAHLGITPAAARALHQLDPDRPIPARDLAARLSCDRSNVTGLVDKLERAGLVRRRVDPNDRRLKTLVVTEDGRRMRESIDRVMSDSRLLAGLSASDLAHLRDLLWKVSDGGCPESGCPEEAP